MGLDDTTNTAETKKKTKTKGSGIQSEPAPRL